MTLCHCYICFLTDKFNKENRPVNTWLCSVFVFALSLWIHSYENPFFEQDFILEHYSEDGSIFQDQIDDLMDLRQVRYNISKRCQVRFLAEIWKLKKLSKKIGSLGQNKSDQ